MKEAAASSRAANTAIINELASVKCPVAERIRGVANCARYSEAEMRGITVVAASLPAFADAEVIMYGTPIPLARPTKADPAKVPKTFPTIPRNK